MPAPSLPTVDLLQPTEIAQPFHRAGWVYEEKYDGWRMVAYNRGDQVQLISRPGRDHTRRFPALVAAIAALGPATLILDGEVCLFDQQLVSRFERLAQLEANPSLPTLRKLAKALGVPVTELLG